MGVCSRLYGLVTDCGSCRCFQPTLPPCGCGGRLVSVPLWRLVWWCVAARRLSVRFPALTPASSGSLLDDLLVAEDARAEEGMVGDIVEPLSSMADLSTPAWKVRSKCRRSHADETCLSADPPCECLTTRGGAPFYRRGWRMSRRSVRRHLRLKHRRRLQSCRLLSLHHPLLLQLRAQVRLSRARSNHARKSARTTLSVA